MVKMGAMLLGTGSTPESAPSRQASDMAVAG